MSLLQKGYLMNYYENVLEISETVETVKVAIFILTTNLSWWLMR